MTEEELCLLQYITSCVIFHHHFDKSYEITEGSKVKENELFEKSISFLSKIEAQLNKEKVE